MDRREALTRSRLVLWEHGDREVACANLWLRRCHFTAKSSTNHRPKLQALMRKKLFKSLSRVVRRPVSSSRDLGMMSPKKIAPVQTVIEAGRLSLLISEVARQHFPKMQETTHKTARWQHTEVKQGIKDMWKAWRSYKREDGNARRVTLEAVFGRWRTWSSYYRLYKQHRERCRATKKTYILEQMNIAEEAACSHNQRLLYQVVRSLAPKSRRGRPQLRDSGEQMMTRSEEATCFHARFTDKFTASADVEDAQNIDCSAYHLTCQDDMYRCEPLLSPQALKSHLSHAPLRKAVPPVAEKVCQVIGHQWTETSKAIPQNWSDAHLVLIRKPAKSGKEAGRYRPIGLQDQL